MLGAKGESLGVRTSGKSLQLGVGEIVIGSGRGTALGERGEEHYGNDVIFCLTETGK